jgi:predicted TIM-barrel fold metal-dependent hydrolase
MEDDDEVPAFWQRLGLPGVIDIHVHFLPPRLLAKVWAYFDQSGPLIGRAWPIRYKWPDAQRIAHLDRLGVRRYPALAYAHRPGMASDLNDWTLDFAAAHPAVIPSATFFPEPEALAYTGSALDRGAQIFKLHLQVGGFDPNDDWLVPVWALLSERGVPVVVHAGSGPVKAAFTGPEPIGRVLQRFPQLKVIVAHLGAPEYTGFLDLAQRYENTALDTTMSFTQFFEDEQPFPKTDLPRLRALGLAGKVLLGSDFPNIPYPYAHQLASLARLGLGDDWLRAVCYRNAAQLLDSAAAMTTNAQPKTTRPPMM